jgi:glucans biosynthesis protein C
MDGLANNRRFDLDWLRIGAFGLLILYHIGMVFVPWDFHIKFAPTSAAVEAPMLLLNAWRLILLFLISGAASRFLLAKRPSGFAISRSRRLLLPLAFGMAVIVAPQAWVDVTVNHSYTRSFLEFWTSDYWRFDKSLGVAVPTWNHLWFVVYLWVYTMLLACGGAMLPAGKGPELQRSFDKVFGSWRLVVLPVLLLVAERLFLADRFPETHALIDDWGMHMVYGFAFFFGFGLAGSGTLWPMIARIWKVAGVIALAAWAIVAWTNDLPGDIEDLGANVLAGIRVLRAIQAWAAILALLGLAQAHFNHDHPWRSTLNEAVFPAYLIHQTIIIVVAFWLRPLELSAWSTFFVLVATTAAGCVAFCLMARNLSWLRPWVGLSKPVLLNPPPHARDADISVG